MEINYINCTVDRWVDGDTVDANVDLGFKIFVKQRFRLAKINTPEKNQPGYIDAITKVNELAPVGSKVIITCYGYDRYGRWIAEVKTPRGLSINAELVLLNLAKPYME